MNSVNLKDWLQTNGGPSIQLYYKNYLDPKIVDKNVSILLDIEKVLNTVNYLDGFNTPNKDKKTLEHLIHFYKESAIENFFPVLYDLAFKKGIAIFDDKIKYLLEAFNFMLTQSNAHCFYYRVMIHQCFYMADYSFDIVNKSFLDRLDKIYFACLEPFGDIYIKEGELPKIPKAFNDRKAIKHELNPFSKTAKKPLPTIYDIKAFAYYMDQNPTDKQIKKIEKVISYILQDEFQKLPEGYGLVWSEDVRRYHACGWSPTLPMFSGMHIYKNIIVTRLLGYLDIMSHFKTACQSDWFKDSIAYLNQYITEDGTYLFPKEQFNYKVIEKAFLSNDNMKLKAVARRKKAYEVVCTFKMNRIFENYEKTLGKPYEV